MIVSPWVAKTLLFGRSLFLIYLLLANITWVCSVCDYVRVRESHK